VDTPSVGYQYIISVIPEHTNEQGTLTAQV